MRSRIGVAVLAVMLVLVPACSNGTKKAAPVSGATKELASKLRLASDSTLKAGSARLALNFAVSGAGAGDGAGAFKADGIADFEKQILDLKMDLLSLGQRGGSLEERLIGDAIYMKSDIFSADLPGGKTWVKLDLKTLGDQASVNFGQLLEQAKSSDPLGPVSFLQGAEGNIETVGREQVRGAGATHYKFKVDLEKASAKLPENLRKEVKPLFDQLGLREFPMDAWVDDEVRVRKLKYAIDLSKAGEDQTGVVTTTMEFYDFGVKVNIAPPPVSEVADFAELLKKASPRAG